MADRDSQGGSSSRLAVAGLVAVGVAVGLWLLLGDGTGTKDEKTGSDDAATTAGESLPTPPATPRPGARAPALRVTENGRLTTTLSELRDGDGYALGLDMPDAARGEGVRDVKVVDVRGRVLELKGEPVDGAGTGLRIDIDPGFLEPGRYMIQVMTAEATPLPVRRYVLQIALEAPAPEPAADLGADAPTE